MKKMNRRLAMHVDVIVIFTLIVAIGSAVAASYVWVDSDVKGVGYKNTEYEVDTENGLANGIEMKELEAGSGLVTAQKWTLGVNLDTSVCSGCHGCVEGLEEHKIFDAEYFPITYQNHSYDAKWQEKKCVKNYDIGAVTDANFVQCEKLQKEETLVTYGDGTTIDGNPLRPGPLSIVQTVTADVLGISHIGFAAKNLNDHHHTIAIGKEETVGNFHIEKTIDIRLSCNETAMGDWLGCP